MRPASKRLGHKKSRGGCQRCKARHVKCDEQRPCGNCVRFDIVCSLTVAASASNSVIVRPNEAHADPTAEGSTSPSLRQGQETPTRRGDSDSATPNPDEALSIIGDLPSPTAGSWTSAQSRDHFPISWMQSLRLLHHYSTVVCSTLSHEPSTAEVWRTTVPEAAFSHEFLMHGLLAVSALHYARSHPDQRGEYVIISTHYQNLALQHFTSRLGEITDSNFEPFFFLATFIFLLTICSISDPQHLGKSVSPVDIAQSFKLLQGIKSICTIQPIEKWSENGPLAPLLQPWKPVVMKQTGAFQARMDRLYTLARELSPSLETINPQSSCLLAVESLRTTYSACVTDESPQRANRIWIWPISLTKLFIELISTNHPVALIILAHYAALARPFQHSNWINGGWSMNILSSVERSLDQQWQEWIYWPRKSVRDGIHVDEMDAS